MPNTFVLNRAALCFSVACLEEIFVPLAVRMHIICESHNARACVIVVQACKEYVQSFHMRYEKVTRYLRYSQFVLERLPCRRVSGLCRLRAVNSTRYQA